MMRQHESRELRRRNLAVRFLVGASASAAFVWGSVPLPASADPEPAQTDTADYGHYGNGTHNRNILSMKSPTHNHGYQHTSTSTAGGSTSIQNAMCRYVTVCNISQIVTPGKAATATQNKADTFTPQKADAVMPKKVDAPASEEVKTLPPKDINPPAPHMGSFPYLGPLGFMMTVSASPISPCMGWLAARCRMPANAQSGGAPPRWFMHQRGHQVMSEPGSTARY
jgi:hypothetical protein